MTEKKTLESLRIGVQIAPNDPFWVQVNETIRQKLNHQMVPFEIIKHGANLSAEQIDELSEELLSSELDAFICMILPKKIIERLLENNIPVVCVEDEIEITHPLFSSVRGWYDAGKIAAQFLAKELHGQGNLLCLAGNIDPDDHIDFSAQRLAGIEKALQEYPNIRIQIIHSYWDYGAAVAHLQSLFGTDKIQPPDAVLGLSDSIVLAAQKIGQQTGLTNENTRFAGINGEPSALAEVVKGRLQATVNIRAEEFAGQAAKVAVDAALGEQPSRYFYFSPELVTRENIAEISVLKLSALSNIATRLVGINRKTEESRLAQYEITSSINRKMTVLNDKQDLASSITEEIRINYEYDRAFFYLISEDQTQFILQNHEKKQISVTEDEVQILYEVYKRRESVFVANTRFNDRFSRDTTWPETQSRVVLPLRFGDKIFGVLDLQSDRPKMHLRNELIGLQAVVDQLGIAIHNAELYADAVQARASAERANQLKIRLLANVSQELRAPMNTIVGYSQAILSNPELYKEKLPEELLRDVNHIFQSGEHLIRLINDLLDVSRAEIGTLDIFLENVAPDGLLRDVFNAMAKQSGESPVTWHLDLPTQLPLIKADPLRLRQVFINLLNNAKKFTEQGHITLGAAVTPPFLHIWVKDTGCGISEENHNLIFEPFSAIKSATQRKQGIGLGLNITRRLVMLHNGKISVESLPGAGTTFHVSLPLPNLVNELATIQPDSEKKMMLVISGDASPVPAVLAICEQQGLEYCVWQPGQNIHEMIDRYGQPLAAAIDLSSLESSSWQQVEQIRADLRLNKIPFLIYTNTKERLGKHVGLTNVLTKPAANDSLYDYVMAFQPENSEQPILVVDDDPEARKLYVRIIAMQLGSIKVIEAENGARALEILKTIVPALIILDLMMPEVDGFEVLKQVRLDRRTRQVPLIIMSGKVLTLEDVKKLDYANVVFQRKNMLTTKETAQCLQKVFGTTDLLPQPTSLMVKQSLAYLHQNYQHPITRDDVAEVVGASPSYLSRIVSQEIGITLWECLVRLRMEYAKDLLLDGTELKNITEVAASVGYDDPAYFCKTFKTYTGFSPVAYRKLQKK